MLNDVKLIREIVEAGANVSHGNQFGTSALMVASLLNNQDAMLALLTAGADIDQVRSPFSVPLVRSVFPRSILIASFARCTLTCVACHQEDLFGNTCFAYASAQHHLGSTIPSIRRVLLSELEDESQDEITAAELLRTAKVPAAAYSWVVASHRAAYLTRSAGAGTRR